MSGGGGASASNAAAVSQIDPRLYSDWQGLNAAAKNVAAQPFQAYNGKLVADDNMFEDLAQYRTLQAADMGQGTLAQAKGVFGQVANESPTWFDAQQASAQGYNPATGQAAQVGDVLDVVPERATAGSIANTGRSQYMNPYIDEVVNKSLSDIDRSRQMQLNDNAAAASHAGAFGGSRHGIVDSQTNEAAQRQSGLLGSQLRAQGFDTASGLMASDIDRAAGISQFNTGQANDAWTGNANRDLAARTFDAGNQQQMGLANLDALNTAGQFGAAAQNANSQFNATQRQQNNQNYGQRDLAVSGLNLEGARGLLGAADQEQSQYLRGAEALGVSGSTQRAADQQRLDAARSEWDRKMGYPQEQLNILSQPFGLIPSNQQSTSNSKSKSASLGGIK